MARSDGECVGPCSPSIAFSTYKSARSGVMDDVHVAEAWKGWLEIEVGRSERVVMWAQGTRWARPAKLAPGLDAMGGTYLRRILHT